MLIAVQLMLHCQSGVNSLPVKQFSNDIAVLLPWASHGFNCSFSGKDQFSNYAHAAAYVGSSTSKSSGCDRCRCRGQSAAWYRKPAGKQAQIDEVAITVEASLEIWS